MNLVLTKPFHLSHRLCRLLFEAALAAAASLLKLRDTMAADAAEDFYPSELDHFQHDTMTTSTTAVSSAPIAAAAAAAEEKLAVVNLFRLH